MVMNCESESHSVLSDFCDSMDHTMGKGNILVLLLPFYMSYNFFS